ncbi:MAG: hypothetical protein K2W82_10605 [Candidatus Obscuribacterales bacterium]|nr:hypothetical protein [Candidatus Obscuribacterales bacterium]
MLAASFVCVQLLPAYSQPVETSSSQRKLMPATPHYDKSVPTVNAPVVPSEPIFALAAPGWQDAYTVTVFAAAPGEAILTADGKEVEEVGDEPADILREYGCIKAICRVFRKGRSICSVNEYIFASPQGAYGAYSVMRQGASTVVIRGDASSEDDNCICFWEHNRFVLLKTNSDNDDEAMAVLAKFADKLSIKSRQTAPLPALFNALPNWDKIKGSEKLFMGPLALRRYSNVPFGNSLMIDRTQIGVIADYAISSPFRERLKLLVLECGNPDLAKMVYGGYATNIGFSSDKVERTDSLLSARLSDSYLMSQILGTRVAVVCGARKKYSPQILLRQVR